MRIALLVILTFLIAYSHARTAYYIRWTSSPSPNVYQGTISITNPSTHAVTDVTVKLTCTRGVNWVQPLAVSQTTNYQISNSPPPYTSSYIDNAPPGNSLVSATYGQMFLVEFSQPVSGLIIDFVSLNNNKFIFSNDFVIASCGSGYWGACSSPVKTTGVSSLGTTTYIFSASGEPHGALLFNGGFSKFVFTSNNDENWYGFSFGALALASDDGNTPIAPSPRNVYYSKWSATPITENGLTKYVGTIDIPRANGVTAPVTVKINFPQGVKLVQTGTGTDYFLSGSPLSPYRSDVVANDPPASSVIELVNAQVITCEFSEPLDGLVFDFVSVNGNTLVFTDSFKLLSVGDNILSSAGYFGIVTSPPVVTQSSSGGFTTYKFSAIGEPHGALLFSGKFDRFVFGTTNNEDWHGFTIGTFGVTLPPPARVPVYYSKWDSTSVYTSTKYTGSISAPDGIVNVEVTAPNGVSFIEGTPTTDYFKAGTVNVPYTGKLFLNAPPAYQIIALQKAQTITIQFSTPVTGLVIDYVSVNANTYVFSDPFTIVAVGDGVTSSCGYWGCTSGVVQTVTSNGYELSGPGEPHGAILFPGSYTKFVFTVAKDENWNGFTIGILGANFVKNCLVSQQWMPSVNGKCPYAVGNCLRIVTQVPETASTSGCSKFTSGIGLVTIDEAGQSVYLSSDAASSLYPVFDEVGVLEVVSPSKTLRGANYHSWENDCMNSNYPSVKLDTSVKPGVVDITSLFGGETGVFVVTLSLFNKYTPKSTTDAYICTKTNTVPVPSPVIKSPVAVGTPVSYGYGIVTDQAGASTQGDLGYSFNTVVFVAVGCSVGSIFLAVVIFGAIAMSVNRKGNSLKETLVRQ